MVVLVNGRGQGNFDITGNSVSNTTGQAISHSAFGLATVTSNISSNTIVANNTVASPGIGVGTSDTFASTDTPSLTTTISSNNISQTDGNGILAVARDATGTLRVKDRRDGCGGRRGPHRLRRRPPAAAPPRVGDGRDLPAPRRHRLPPPPGDLGSFDLFLVPSTDGVGTVVNHLVQ